MQRDLKVGLSLGVLVLGVVGALLFRREQVSDTPQHTLKTARKIDERIAERSRTPYMTGDVEFDEDETAAAQDPNKTGKDVANGERPTHAVPPSWLNEEEDPFQVTKNDHGKFDYKHGTDAASRDVIPLQPRNPARPDTQVAESGSRTHVIQSGDSLSVLAERYLGSQGRFQEIYEANRDVLTDVNRLPVGATIVIPNETKAAAKSGVETAHSNTTARTTSSHADAARGTITDITTFEPLVPPSDETKSEEFKSPLQSQADKAKPADATPHAKLPEAKKFVPPTRLPFANHNGAAVHHKTSTGTNAAAQTKPATATESAGDTDTESRSYQVRRGDSLERISTKIYGNSKRAGDIFAANKAILASPDALREGQELVLPE